MRAVLTLVERMEDNISESGDENTNDIVIEETELKECGETKRNPEFSCRH